MSKAVILVVEDEPLIADDIAQILEKKGYEISGIADEAEDALNIIDSTETDIALLDINIEGETDGIELASKLSTRNYPHFKQSNKMHLVVTLRLFPHKEFTHVLQSHSPI